MPRCVRAVIALGIACESLLRADITLVDYTTNPAAVGSPAIESSSNGSGASNIFGTSGVANFLTLDLTGFSGSVTLSEVTLLVSSMKFHASGAASIASTTALLQNSRFLIGVVPYVETLNDVQATISSVPAAFDLTVGVDAFPTGIVCPLVGGSFDVMKITTSAETFSGVSIPGGQKYSLIFQETGFFDLEGETYSNGPLTLTVSHPGNSDCIFSAYESGFSIYEETLHDRDFAYSISVSISIPPATPYQSWAHAVFSDLPGTFQHTDAAITADPDGDGLGNGIEYAFGSNPRDPVSGLGRAPVAKSNGCTFLLPVTVPAGIRLRVEGSDSMTHWTTHATWPPGGPWSGPVVLAPEGASNRATFTDPTPSIHRFFRMAAEEP
jgi:hypothetical protein